ncbi:MAG: nitroreductase family protein [Candidatus Cloacimonetes bacterium]|jgi:nitroreductase|nr:nitroreductase family protein [Candidatus Cloacimonadota bacterium]MCK9336021.1 nitroreductase family protein [Candidatus Cloacimonadota bacterium]MDD2544630.1 nitroreductase family protein [Candidatus Cloacimonadota bacterium]MDD2682959.1 nitroreductase family protein [Candidatus Cloacimonadota bacterium]MDD3096631.1 nitroreductase family protein [Candidatus Cloacimonadota bacterium]
MNFLELVQSRHSVRSFTPDPIPDDILQQILEAGRQAPSAQNRQPWRYLVFRDPQQIKVLAKRTGLIGLSNFFIKDAPCLIVACADMKKNVRINAQDYYLVDTAISFQQMMLCAHSHGIGSCWLAAFSEKTLAKYLQIPKHWRIVALAPFGYPRADNSLYGKALSAFSGSSKRLAIEEIVSFRDSPG